MKNVLILLSFIGLGLMSCSESSNNKDVSTTVNDTTLVAKITFDETVTDFGKLAPGDVVMHTFKFTNTGNKDLIIERVKPTCGCTAPTYTKDPVKPGEKGEIQIKYNSAGHSGKKTKSVSVISNAESVKDVLTFHAEIIKQ